MIEVMVGAVLSLIVVAAALALLMVSQKTTIINGQVAATQQNSRSAMDCWLVTSSWPVTAMWETTPPHQPLEPAASAAAP